MESPPTVFVVDDDQAARQSVTALLQAHGFVCVECDSADSFLAAYNPQQASCLLVDLDMPGKSGLDLCHENRQRGWIIPTVVVAGYSDAIQTSQAIQKGVIAVLEKPYEREDLLEAVRQGLDTDANNRASARQLANLNERFSQLTDSETKVLDRIVSGRSISEIAAELTLDDQEVARRKQSISTKLGVESVPALVALIVERDQLIDRERSLRGLTELSLQTNPTKHPES